MTTPLPDWFDDNQTERLLREKYEPLLSADDYARLREKCGLGAVIDGEASDEPFPSAFTVTERTGPPPVVEARLNRERPTR